MRLAPVLALMSAACASSFLGREGFHARSVLVAGSERRFVVYVPRDYVPERTWPLVVFLNGAGECGDDGWKQLAAGLGPALLHHPDEWPCLVLFPQKPNRESQWEDWEEMVLAQLAAVQAEFRIDPARITLTGLSQGGHGTWVLGARHADRFAALAPICGYGDPAAVAAALREMPIRAFHGDADRAVPVAQSQALCDAVRAAGGQPQLTIYPGVGHNSWDKAYRGEKLAAWLLAQRKKPRG